MRDHTEARPVLDRTGQEPADRQVSSSLEVYGGTAAVYGTSAVERSRRSRADLAELHADGWNHDPEDGGA